MASSTTILNVCQKAAEAVGTDYQKWRFQLVTDDAVVMQGPVPGGEIVTIEVRQPLGR